MSCSGINALNPICQVQDFPKHLASDAFSQIAQWFAQAASAAANGLWSAIDSATTVDLGSPGLATDLVATSAIAGVLCLGLFIVQVVTSVLRRDPGGLGRAVKGLFIALVASVFALALTRLLFGAVDALSAGIVRYAMDTNMQGLGRQLGLVSIASTTNNPAVVLLISIVVLAAVVVVWAAMMIRKLMIIVAAVMTPLAFSGATADVTRGWVRRWIEFTAAMVASKLLLVIILMVGVSVLEGAGRVTGAGPGQDVTQLATGALLLLMGGFAPWIAIKMFHFAGDSLQAAHSYAAQAPTGARTVISAPQKVNSLHSQAASATAKLSRNQSTTPMRPKTSSELLAERFGSSGASGSTSGLTSAGSTATRGVAGAGAGGAAAAGAAGAAAAPLYIAKGTIDAANKAGQTAAGATSKAAPGTAPCTGFVRATSEAELTEIRRNGTSSHGLHHRNPPPATVRFARRSSRGLILGLSGLQVACIAAAATVALPALFTAGGTGLLITSCVWVTLLAVAFAPWEGQPAVQTLPTAGHFLARRAAGQTSYRARPSKPRPTGTLALPGECASLRFHEDDDSGAVMVHDPHRQTLTAVARVSHPAYVLLSPDDQARRVHGWGRALAGLAASGLCARVQVLESSLPDSGHGITGWWAEHGSSDSSQWAVQQYDELMATMAPAASTHRTLVALSLNLRKSARAIRATGRGLPGAAAVLGQEMANFETSLRAAELKVDAWLDTDQLAASSAAPTTPRLPRSWRPAGLGMTWPRRAPSR